MSQLKGTQIEAGLELLIGNNTFTPSSQTSAHLGSNNGGNAFPLLPEGSLYLTHQLHDKVTVGLGLLSFFGLAEKYNNDWVGRYYVQEGALLGLSFVPSVSYQVNDWLSVGAGMNAMDGIFKSQIAVNNAPWFGSDGQMKLEDNNWGFGATGGLLVKLSDKTRFGLSYQSRVKLDFSAVPGWSNLSPGLKAILAGRGSLNSSIDLGMTVPQQVMGGLHHELSDKWSVMVDAGWQNWAQFGYVDVAVSDKSGDLTYNSEYQDTWHLGGGAIYKCSEKWTFTGGLGYDSSPVNDANRSVTLPMGQQWRFGLGAMYQVSRKVTVGAAWDLIWMGQLNVDQYRGPLAAVRRRHL